jgi:hypothetical protein
MPRNAAIRGAFTRFIRNFSASCSVFVSGRFFDLSRVFVVPHEMQADVIIAKILARILSPIFALVFVVSHEMNT